ncbi:MAG: hypothetical protein O3A20_01505 [Planctomycetota bacterium]|nr:hypothetical protein [Planctomycetota bacterium]
MRRLLPWLLIAAIAAILALVFYDGADLAAPATGDQSADEATTLQQPASGAALDPSAQPSRSGATGAVVVRVVDATGKPADATLHLLQDGEPARVQAVRGSAQILPPPQQLSVVAESGGSWSKAEHWSASEPGNWELLLSLGAERGAGLSVQVSIDGEGPAAGAQVRVLDGTSSDPWRRMLEGLALRAPDDSEQVASAPTESAARAEAPAPPEALPQAPERPDGKRIARRSLARETWTADDQGTALLPGLQAGAWSFEVRSPGCSPEFFEIELAEGDQSSRDVLLQRSGVVVGRVLGPGGAAMNRAEVGLWPQLEGEMPWFDPMEDFTRYGRMPGSIPAELRTTCDTDGRFEIASARAGEYLVLVTADGLRPATSAKLTVEPRGRTDAGDLKLQRGHEIAVSVRGPTGEPVAGASLNWRAGESIMGMLSQGSDPLFTDGEGNAALQGLPSAEITVTVEHGSFAREKRTFTLSAGLESFPKSWEVTLRAGASLSGTVLSAGASVQGARLRVLPPQGEAGMLSAIFEGEASAVSGIDGGFRFERLPPGTWRVGVDHDDHARLMTEAFEFFEGDNAPLILRLAEGGTLVIHVLDEEGAAVEGAVVLAQETVDFQSETGTTDADGLTIIEHLPPGRWRLMRVDQMQNQDPQDLRLDMKFLFVTLEDGERKEVQLGGPVERADVSGLLTMNGQPLAKHSLVLIGNGGVRTERTDDNGVYLVNGVALGEYMVTVTSTLGGGSSWSGALVVRQPGTMQHDIELPSSTVEVLVVDGVSGAPVAGVPVNLRPEDASSVSGGAFQKSNAEGIASFALLVPGRYLAAVGNLAMPMLGGGEGLGSTMVQGIVVASENSGTQRVEARLPQSAQLRVRVTGPDGNYLAGAHVHCLSVDGQALNFFSTKGSNGKGVVELSGLPPGSHRFLARHPQIGSREFEVVLVAGQLTKSEVSLQAGVQLRVSVTDADGAPLSGVLAVAMEENGRPLFYFTIEESQEINQSWFSGAPQRVGPLDPGSYVIRLHRPGYAAVDHRVTVAASPALQDVRLRFTVE